MSHILHPITFVNISIHICHLPNPLAFIFLEPSFIFISILVVICALSMLVSLRPLAIVTIISSKKQDTKAISEPVFPIAFVFYTASISVSTSTMWSSSSELSLIDITIGKLIQAETIR